MYEALAWAVAAIALFSSTAVGYWAESRRKEREAYYKAEVIKKVAEMQGNTPEPVLALLREALATPPPRPNPFAVVGSEYRKEREAYYRAETLKRMADSTGVGADMMLQYLREEERKADQRRRGGLRLAGLIVTGVGIGVTIFLHELILDMPIFLAGLIPTLVGVALLAYSYILADSDAARPVS
jgi:hypothetical protein